MRATHSQKLERWIPLADIESISSQMKNWYGPPIAMGNVPGRVYACPGGDFRGHIEAGSEASIEEWIRDSAKRIQAHGSRRLRRWLNKQLDGNQLNTGFTGIADLAAEARHKTQTFNFRKTGPNGITVGSCGSLWGKATNPPAGGVGAAAPGGAVCDRTTVGGFTGFQNAIVSGDTNFFAGGYVVNDTSDTRQLLLYDRLWHAAKLMSSTSTEAFTGQPNRYNVSGLGGVTGDLSCEGNFVFPEITTGLGATSHNWTICKYMNQEGDVEKTFPSVAGEAGSNPDYIDFANTNRLWFMPLAAGDKGLTRITQWQCSASVTGAVTLVMGHPIAWFPCHIQNIITKIRPIQSAFQFEQVLDNACLAFLSINHPDTLAATYTGSFQIVSG